MPYEIRNGVEVWHKKGSKWSLKQKATSAKNAGIILGNLRRIDAGKTTAWGARLKARKGK